MNNKDKWLDLEGLLINLELSAGKANYLVCDLLEMESDSATDYIKLYNWENIEMLSQMLLDYVINITKDIEAASKLYYTLSESAADKTA